MIKDLTNAEIIKPDSKTKALDGIKNAQLNRHKFTLEFKAEVVQYKKAENLNFDQCGRKFDIAGKQVQRWEVLYDLVNI